MTLVLSAPLVSLRKTLLPLVANLQGCTEPPVLTDRHVEQGLPDTLRYPVLYVERGSSTALPPITLFPGSNR